MLCGAVEVLQLGRGTKIVRYTGEFQYSDVRQRGNFSTTDGKLYFLRSLQITVTGKFLYYEGCAAVSCMGGGVTLVLAEVRQQCIVLLLEYHFRLYFLTLVSKEGDFSKADSQKFYFIVIL